MEASKRFPKFAFESDSQAKIQAQRRKQYSNIISSGQGARLDLSRNWAFLLSLTTQVDAWTT